MISMLSILLQGLGLISVLSFGPILALGDRYTLSQDAVELWNPIEIRLTSQTSFQNAYLQVDLNGTFTSPQGHVLVSPGFWDGNQSFIIRFAPNETGVWSFITSCNAADAGLSGVKGSFSAVPYTGSIRSYKHGFLQVQWHS